MGRILALCRWLAWQLRRPFPARIGRRAVPALGGLLLVVALVPLAAPSLDSQPEDATVQQIMDAPSSSPMAGSG